MHGFKANLPKRTKTLLLMIFGMYPLNTLSKLRGCVFEDASVRRIPKLRRPAMLDSSNTLSKLRSGPILGSTLFRVLVEGVRAVK